MECTPAGYWEMRSLAQFIRKKRTFTKACLYTKRPLKHVGSPAFNARSLVGLKTLHPPSCVNGDKNIEQCVAIMRDVADTHGLGARSVQEAAQLKDLEQWAEELSANLAIAFTTNPASGCLLNNYRKNMASMLEPWAEFLKGRQWVLGTRLTYVDFLLYEALDWHHELSPDAFLNYPVLMEYRERFREYPYHKKQSPQRHWREGPTDES